TPSAAAASAAAPAAMSVRILAVDRVRRRFSIFALAIDGGVVAFRGLAVAVVCGGRDSRLVVGHGDERRWRVARRCRLARAVVGLALALATPTAAPAAPTAAALAILAALIGRDGFRHAIDCRLFGIGGLVVLFVLRRGRLACRRRLEGAARPS